MFTALLSPLGKQGSGGSGPPPSLPQGSTLLPWTLLTALTSQTPSFPRETGAGERGEADNCKL